jgi:hypothetical protein
MSSSHRASAAATVADFIGGGVYGGCESRTTPEYGSCVIPPLDLRHPTLSVRFVPLLVAILLTLVIAVDARAEASVEIKAIVIDGNARTREVTFLDLLPRPLPNRYTRAEVAEFERRVRNLSLFDDVSVGLEGSALHVRVREKTTIAPIVELSTGKTLRDSSGKLGVVEYNLFGRAIELGGSLAYSGRGPQVEAWIMEHSFRPRRWNFELETFFVGSEFRFEGEDTTWQRTRAGAEISLKAPYSYRSPLRYEQLLTAYREILTFVEGGGPLPRGGVYLGVGSELTWDRYRFHDLVPSGWLATLELRPGVFVGPAEPRHEARLTSKGSVPLGLRTALVVRGVFEAANGGNVNHSALIGSQRGVRGLPDTLYRNGWIAFANVELRHAFELATRWFLQPVAFTDAGCFQPLGREGGFEHVRRAIALGGSIRLLLAMLSV